MRSKSPAFLDNAVGSKGMGSDDLKIEKTDREGIINTPRLGMLVLT
jgi:hypothetical protein